MKKLLLNLLAISVITTGVVACNSGSSSSPASGPAAPAVSQLTPPNGFEIPTDSASGAAFNVAGDQIALPGASGYTIFSFTADVAGAIRAAGGTANVKVTASNGQFLLTMPSTTPNETLTYALTPTQTQSQQLQAATPTTAVLYRYPSTGVLTNLITVSANGLTPAGLSYGYSRAGDTGIAIIPPASSPVTPLQLPLSGCAGATGTPSTISATITQSVGYFAVGTTTGSVCVFNGADLSVTNLSAQAPAGKYTAGNVNNFGFPATLNTGNTLVGYWNVGTVGSSVNIYRVTGTYDAASGAPTGNGFLNTTIGSQQTTINGTTKVTFTGFPANNIINSSYTDATGNVWVGTTTGSVYVLRAGATQWTASALAASAPVYVQTNGTNSGTTGVVNGTSFSVN